MANELVVRIVGDSKSIERAMARSSKAVNGFNQTVTASVSGTSLKRQVAGFATGYLAVGSAATVVTAGLKTSIDAASNLNEQISKSEVVFGSAAAEIKAWSGTTARSIGIAQDEALAAAGTFGNLFVTMGIGQETSAGMSRQLVQLAADLAAFNNTNPTEALDALRSGLVGEAEPLRRYGVRLSEARVQQAAMAETGKTNARALTEQEKALARYRIILDDTKTAQGNFKDTQAGFAQQTKILRAEIRDLSAEIGNALIPVLTDAVGAMNDGVGVGRSFAGMLGDIADKLPLPNFVRDNADKLLFATFLGPIKAGAATLGFLNDKLRGTQKESGLAAKDLIEMARAAEAAGNATATIKTPETPALTAEQRRQFFDARINRMQERVQDIPSLKGQIARLREIASLIRDRMAATKDITRRLALEDELLGVQREIRGKQEQIRANAAEAERRAVAHQKEMAELARDRAKAAREQAVAAAAAATSLKFGWLDFAVERAEATKSTKDDVRAYRALEAALLARIRAEGRTLELVQQLWRVRQRIRDLRKPVAGGGGAGGGRAGVNRPDLNLGGIPGGLTSIADAADKATAALTRLQGLRFFADLRKFGGNLWTRAGAAMAGGIGGDGGGYRGLRGELAPIGWKPGRQAPPARGQIQGPGIKPYGGGVTVNQFFQAPTPDRHREARYALNATRAVFDT